MQGACQADAASQQFRERHAPILQSASRTYDATDRSRRLTIAAEVVDRCRAAQVVVIGRSAFVQSVRARAHVQFA